MKLQLRLEGLGLFLVSILAYHWMGYSWKLFFILFLTPDLGFLGYGISTRAGAFTYNLLHHQGFISVFLALGIILREEFLVKISLIYLAHSNIDRFFGYGLRHPNDMHNTHLGKGGKAKHH